MANFAELANICRPFAEHSPPPRPGTSSAEVLRQAEAGDRKPVAALLGGERLERLEHCGRGRGRGRGGRGLRRWARGRGTAPRVFEELAARPGAAGAG